MSSFDTKVTFKTITNDINKSDSAIKEAIANSIDANSKNIYINIYEETTVDSTVNVTYFCLDIADDGEGIPTEKNSFENVFCQYKVSTKDKKSQYGKKGKGRYTYLTITKSPDSMAIFTKNSDNEIYRIYFECKDNENIRIIQEKYKEEVKTQLKNDFSTLIQFKNLDELQFNIKKNTKEEIISDIKNEIISFFADTIASKSKNIYLNNELLDIDNYLQKEIVSKEIIIKDIKFNIDFYIWNEKIKLKSDRQKHILFFDSSQVLRGILPSGKHKIAFNGYTRDHSVIVKSEYFSNKMFDELDYCNNLFSDSIVLNLKKEIELILENILFELYKENIEKVSDEYINFLNISKDEITKDVYHALLLPFVEKFGKQKISKDLKSVIAKLVNILASESPDTFINNLKTILSLTEEESIKIEYIQENYGIIKAITEKEKLISRIDILNMFDNMVNGINKKEIQERTELHKVIEKNLWIISEQFEDIEYSDISSDESLKTILENKNFYQFDSSELKKIVKEHNTKKIPDIFIPIHKDNIIYIIELKKPTVPIDKKIMDEIEEKYINTIKKINKNYKIKKKIMAYAISDEIRGNVYPRGNIDSYDMYSEAKSWGELIEETRGRYNNKITDLDNKLKTSKWQNLTDFVSSHKS